MYGIKVDRVQPFFGSDFDALETGTKPWDSTAALPRSTLSNQYGPTAVLRHHGLRYARQCFVLHPHMLRSGSSDIQPHLAAGSTSMT